MEGGAVADVLPALVLRLVTCDSPQSLPMAPTTRGRVVLAVGEPMTCAECPSVGSCEYAKR